MKIALTSTGPDLGDMVDPRFGRCPFFIVLDPDTMEKEAFENPSITLGGGAGIQSAQLMAEKGAQAVLTGNCGPNAFQTLVAANIQVITGVGGTVREAVEQFKAGAFSATSGPTVDGHFGMGSASPSGPAATGDAANAAMTGRPTMGGGPGMGMGRGGGGGMGRGGGGGMGRGGGGGMGRGGGGGMGRGATPLERKRDLPKT